MRSDLRARGVAIALAVVVCASPLPAAAVTFTDGVFSNSNWSGVIVAESGPAAAFSAQQVLTGGNPDEFRRLQHFYGGNGNILTGHLNSSAVYDPGTEGAIGTVQFGFDLNLFNGGESNGVAFGALLQQGASVYTAGLVLKCAPAGASAPCASITTNQWTEHDLGALSAAAFSRASGAGPAQPDFSDTGAAIQFGYYAGNGTGGVNRTSTDSGLDNWSVTVAPAAVPEPGTLALLSGGATALALLRRRRHTT